MTKEQNSQGFSLIELLVAFALMMFVLLSTAQLLIFAQSVFSRYRDLVQSSHYMLERLERLRALPLESPELQAGDYTADHTDPVSQRTYVLQWSIRDTNPSQKTVSILCHPSGHVRRRAETELLLLERLGF
jgi:Tfp pilus assembly protein PilV